MYISQNFSASMRIRKSGGNREMKNVHLVISRKILIEDGLAQKKTSKSFNLEAFCK